MNQPDPLPSPFRIIPLARLAKGGRWRTEARRSYGAPVLYWFTRGQGRITIAGQTSGYGPHNAVFVPSGCMHGFEMSSQVHGLIIVFPAGSETSIDLPDTPLQLRLREVDQHLGLSKLLENLQAGLGTGAPEADTAMMCHAGLLSVWLRRQINEFEEEAEVAPRSS
ncbi:MAG TPA: AraC family transcriptional regulator, partial [Aliiroseovarius sp.]|nr:AraC family transcriptional regulator [Aliiroseovarius sp.]